MAKRRVTSHDVAALANVSRTTVSFVLNSVPGVNISESTRQRVLDATRQLNYHPDSAARRLASGKSHTIGLVMRQNIEQVVVDAFFPQVILGLSRAAAQQNFYILLNTLLPDDRKGYARLIRENHVDGIVLSGPRLDDQELIQLHAEGVPVILMGQLPGTSIPFVDVNAVEAASKAVKHLIDLGHTRIAMITNASFDYTSAQDRRAGYRQELASHNLSCEESWIQIGDFTPDSGYAAMNTLLQLRPHPTAVFVASDVVAFGAIRAVKQAGLRVPQDVAIVGFDDVPLSAHYDPSLSTVRLPAYGIGWAAGERIVRLIQRDALQDDSVLLDTELIVRQSSEVALTSNA